MLEKNKSLLLVTEARLRNSKVRRLSILGSLVEPLSLLFLPNNRSNVIRPETYIHHGQVIGAGRESSHSSGRPCQHFLFILGFGRC